MGIFGDIVRSLLNEGGAPSSESIVDAIEKKYRVDINYDSPEEKDGKGKRTIEPVTYGLTQGTHMPVIRAFQPYGDTSSTKPGWKFFRVDRITSWTPYKKQTFKEPPGNKYYPRPGEKFNPNGDDLMSVVYKNADFNKEPEAEPTPKPTRGLPTQSEKDIFSRRMKNFKNKKKYGNIYDKDYQKNSLEDKYKDMIANYEKDRRMQDYKQNTEDYWTKDKKKDTGVGPLDAQTPQNNVVNQEKNDGVGPLDRGGNEPLSKLSMSPDEMEALKNNWKEEEEDLTSQE